MLTWNLLTAVQDIKSTQPKYNYNKGNFRKINIRLQSLNWDDRWMGKTVNEMWTDFTQILKEQVDLHVPLKTEGRKRPTKLSKQTQKMIRERSKTWQKYWKNSSGRNFAEYKRIRNEVNRSIRREEHLERKRILKGFKGNPKRFYGFMRHRQSGKDNIIAPKKESGELTETDQQTADLLSTYFQQVYAIKDTTSIPQFSAGKTLT